MVPEPSLKVPFHSAKDVRIAMLSSLSQIVNRVDRPDYTRLSRHIV
jgi:hypothetical protein